MQEKIPLSYRTIQRIKAEEYERFFSGIADYALYMNHLGEVRWMKEQEALRQHEFFLYSLSSWEKLKRSFRLRRKINLTGLPRAERELRLHFRYYLEEEVLGKIRPQTAKVIPEHWTYDLNRDDLKNIPLTLDYGSEVIWKRIALVVALLAIFSLIGFFWVVHFGKPEGGKLQINSNLSGARVYMDDSHFLGYTNKMLVNIPEGPHRLTFSKEGYSAEPLFYDVEISRDSVVTLDVKFVHLRSEFYGYLQVIAEQRDSKIFVNDRYYGTAGENVFLRLEQGRYQVVVQKAGFVAIPAEKLVTITPGDTSVLTIQQVAVGTKTPALLSGSTENIGSIEIISDVKNASIFLNGRNSGEKTDHVFTQLSLGNYTVRIEKKGYACEPQLIDLNLTKSDPAGNAVFRLVAQLEKVRITTTPSQGKIFVDGDFQAEGQFEGMLDIGDHRISFGDIPGFITPRTQVLSVKAGLPITINAAYFPVLQIAAGISEHGTVYADNCEVLSGYTFKDRAFTASTEGGPSIEYYTKLKEYFWKLGFAFPYRNPKGNDALKFTFELPRNMNYDQKFTLKMYAASSREKYPLSLSATVDISVKLNNTILSYYYAPEFIEDLNSIKPADWDITSSVRGGVNTLEISTTDRNNTYFFLKKVEINNLSDE
jgi:hypothetical protein